MSNTIPAKYIYWNPGMAIAMSSTFQDDLCPRFLQEFKSGNKSPSVTAESLDLPIWPGGEIGVPPLKVKLKLTVSGTKVEGVKCKCMLGEHIVDNTRALLMAIFQALPEEVPLNQAISVECVKLADFELDSVLFDAEASIEVTLLTSK